MDTYNMRQKNNPVANKTINELKSKLGLVDPWRIFNPEKYQYTWRQSNPLKQSRLDYFLVSEEVMSLVDHASIGFIHTRSTICIWGLKSRPKLSISRVSKGMLIDWLKGLNVDYHAAMKTLLSTSHMILLV